jgi:hypothetical protein
MAEIIKVLITILKTNPKRDIISSDYVHSKELLWKTHVKQAISITSERKVKILI